MTVPALVLVIPAILVGAAAQRVTGVGFAQVVAPFLVLAYGPFGGVMVLNLVAGVSAAIVLGRVWSDIEWRKFSVIIAAAAFGIPAGAWLAATLPSAPLELVVGVLLVVTLIVSLTAGRTAKAADGAAPLTAAGFVGGALSASVGVGGPAIVVYAVLSRWPHRAFLATVQAFFVCSALASFATKLALAPDRMPGIEWWAWLVMGVALLTGLLVGDLASSRIPHHVARRAVLAIAFAGAIVTTVRGVVELTA